MAKSKTVPAVVLPDEPPHIGWTVAQLKLAAGVLGVDLGKTRVKAQILELIEAAAAPVDPVTVLDATNHSIAKALEDKILDRDLHAAPIAALRVLAQRIDDADTLADFQAVYASNNNLRPPSQDNVSIPTYLKYCEALGLTVAGVAKKVEPPKEGEPSGSKLGNLRSLHTGQSA